MATKKKKDNQEKTPKQELGDKLKEMRKEMNSDTVAQWFAWAKTKKPGLTEVTFNAITRGERLAEKNLLFAIELAKEGRRLVDAFNQKLTEEVNSI